MTIEEYLKYWCFSEENYPEIYLKMKKDLEVLIETALQEERDERNNDWV